MQAMKRWFCCLSALLLLFCSPSLPARRAAAEESPQYAVADARDVYFYADRDEDSGLFLIPYTYYVKVLSLGDPFCAVEYLTDTPPYKKVTGYCKTSDLTFVDFVPERPYLTMTLSVTYVLPDPPALATGDLSEVTVEYAYYGEFPVGSAKYRYVYGNGKFGYLPADGELVYDLNTDYLQPSSGEADLPEQPQGGGLSGMQIFFLCALCVSVAAIAALVIRGKKAPAPAPEEDF